MESEQQDAATSGDENTAAEAQDTMRAIVQDAYGSPDVFGLAQINTPKIADDQVLVSVRAAGWTGVPGI